MRLLYGVVFLFYMHTMISSEYIYPVASLDEDNILYIHQTSPRSIQLFEWNTITNHTEQILWSLFNPVGIQLLPDNSGFSFIDNGRLRIKAFQKRSPKTIDFDEPIFNINALHWIDEHTCYCSAYYNNHFSLFELHDDGRVKYLTMGNDNDCMYPQKIDSHLFYIERNRSNTCANYRIMQTEYNTPQNNVIIDFQDKPIIFLNMISEKEGFVIEHAKTIESESKTGLFLYYQLIKMGDTWEKERLFTFEVPTALFLYDNEQRLFESILPLLPRIIDNKIYFTDCSHNDGNLEPYYYDLSKNQTHKLFIANQPEQGHLFVPMLCGTKLCCGGTKNGKELAIFVF